MTTAPPSGSPTTLAIECASEACSVALFASDGHHAPTLLAGEQRVMGRGHAEALVPMIAALPNRGRASGIVVGLGPGSFTGARIGLACARALGLAWDVPVFGYPTLALIAAMARALGTPQPVLVATTAGHGEWFTQGFDATGTQTTELASLTPDAALAQWRTLGSPLLAGTQAEALLSLAGTPQSGQTALPLLPDARATHLLDAHIFTPALAPLYGRAPDAKLPAKLPTPRPA